ncbi:proton-associated sugar transporter A-like [Pollicipes pollicipes]|uniref:proton-associated sugar transporter A-like n=1 Tax=Pollicipes pollicipes TaxID=41117 RepID=UPI001885970B|nr:proton-associated sugar transporter A-like [Pollicipes pollicipes]
MPTYGTKPLGLILVPNGALIGQALGDQYDAPAEPRVFTGAPTNLTYPLPALEGADAGRQYHTHPWGIFFTIVGTVLLDFDSDACQSPARAFLLDITVPEDHARGLSTFTIMAGLGGALGYAMGGINWDATVIGEVFGGHVRAVFTLVLFIYIACLMTTLCSFPEIPLDLINAQLKEDEKERNVGEGEVMLTVNPADEAPRSYGTVTGDTSPSRYRPGGDEPRVTLKEYLLSIVYMPASLRAAVGSASRSAYEDGVRFGCWGMAIYSLSCSVYSFLIESLVRKFRARPVYVGGQLVYAVGMVFMATLRHRVAVIVFSACAGVMYSTLFTMPYLLVAHYHVSGSRV